MAEWLGRDETLSAELTDAFAVPRRPVPVLGILAALSLMAVLAAAMVGVAALVHALRTEPRDAAALVTSEITLGMLDQGEHALRAVPVLRRSAGNFYRATHGLLVLTERRVLYVGLTPRDILDPGDELPTFERLGLAVDTSLSLRAGRTRIRRAPALVLTAPYQRAVLAVEGGKWPDALSLLHDIAARQQTQRTEAAQQRLARDSTEAAARRPVYHVVRRGEALANIARQYDIPLERLREMNRLESNRIRAGDSILIKPRS